MTDDKHAIYQKVYKPDGLMVSLNAGLVGGTNFFTKCKVYSLSGTTISTATYGSQNIIMARMWGHIIPLPLKEVIDLLVFIKL